MSARILNSPGGDISLPEDVPNLSSLMMPRLRQYGERVAVIDPVRDIRLTFTQVADNVETVYWGLKKLGVKEGDVVCMFTPNCCEYYYVFYSIAMLRAKLTTANPSVTSKELADQLQQAQASRIIVTPQSAEKALQAIEETGLEFKDLIVVDGEMEGMTSFSRVMELGASERKDGEKEKKEEIKDDSTWDTIFHLPFTSGTTGRSKGVKVGGVKELKLR